MQTEQFATKTNRSLLCPLERRIEPFVVRHVPRWLETYHLTMLTLLCSALILLFSYLAAGNIRWLWLVSLMVALHYLTDHFDGKVGKYRNTGLFRWGFYMDHFLDYIFLCSVFIGYALILPERATYNLLLVLAVFSAFMFNSFLVFTATEEFRISLLKLGPTEFHIALIVINSLSIHFGTHHMESALPYVAACALAVLALLVYRTQKRIWTLDADAKERARQSLEFEIREGTFRCRNS